MIHAQSACSTSAGVSRRAGRTLLLLLPLLLAACRDNEVVTYDVPKDKSAPAPASADASSPHANMGMPAAAPDASMAGQPVATAAGPGLVWTAPATWQPKPLGAMRKGSFTIAGDAGAAGDLSITAFPGAVGGELANLNRWRGQLGLPPVAESDLAASVEHVSRNGLTFTLVDLTGPDPDHPQRMLGAMAPYGDAMWFFKLTGPAALIAGTKPAFLEFLSTVKPATP